MQEKLNLHKFITASFLDFLQKLHYITLPAFLLKGECLYRHLKAEDKNAFFKDADLWLDEQEFNQRKVLNNEFFYSKREFKYEYRPGKAIFYTMENPTQIIPQCSNVPLPDMQLYLSNFFYKMSRKTKEENQAAYFEYLKKERPSTIMSNVTGDWGHNERTRKANYFESLKA